MILIITNKEDTHPVPVIEKLREWGVSFLRLNTESLLTDYEFAWWARGGACDFRLRNLAAGVECLGSQISAVWERRPMPPKDLPVAGHPKVEAYNRAEALEFLVFLRHYIAHIPSIGSILLDRHAASKMLQMHLAQEVGFLVPDTLFANRRQPVMDFAAEHPLLALKSISTEGVWMEDEGADEYTFYTRQVAAESLSDVPEEAFTQTVNFVQAYVEKAYELRITVVGEEVFACRIDAQQLADNEGKVDWRQGYDHGMQQTAYTLPTEVADRCRLFLQRMWLNFGCFDFVVTPSGEYVFLECNPNGQWLWVEIETGLPISEAVARWLTKKIKN